MKTHRPQILKALFSSSQIHPGAFERNHKNTSYLLKLSKNILCKLI